jgi:hypothetical protein
MAEFQNFPVDEVIGRRFTRDVGFPVSGTITNVVLGGKSEPESIRLVAGRRTVMSVFRDRPASWLREGGDIVVTSGGTRTCRIHAEPTQ